VNTTTPTQLEFDLVSPELGAPDLPALDAGDADLRELRGRLQHEDLLAGLRPVIPSDELDQARVLLGETEWKKNHRLWERRFKTNPRRFRKVLLSLRVFFNL
jgi:hypothetical protein